MSRVAFALLLAGVYLLTLASLDPLDAVLGLVLGSVMVLALPAGRAPSVPGPADPSPAAVRLLYVPWFALGVLADIARGTWDVALRVLHLRPVERPGIVLVPIGDRSPRGVAVSALATTLSPGSVLVEVDEERRAMVLHVIDATDPDAIRAQHARFYERYQRRVFP